MPVVPVGPDGKFTYPVSDYAGMHVFDANAAIIEPPQGALSRAGRDLVRRAARPARRTEGTVLLRRETYDHSYPHCWRCREPLIYMAVSSWFVSTTAIRDRMLELNQQITWVPEHVKDGQFGKWLENTRDWSITPQPVLGQPDPGVEVATTRRTRGSTCTARWPSCERDFGVPA